MGRAVLSAADQNEDSENGVLVLLGSADPLAYGLVMARLVSHGAALIIDPYMTDRVLLDLLKYTGTSRILTSSKGPRGRERATAVAAFGGANGQRFIEVRVSDQLHDRYVISQTGDVEALGTSLNSVNRNVTAFVPISGQPAQLVREHYEQIWTDARPLNGPTPAGETSTALRQEDN